VLLNGRRVVNVGIEANSSVDLNMIPLALIERGEVPKDGASAIYGADAVAGVINSITKTVLKGGKASVRYGETSRGDGNETAVDLSWGFQAACGSVVSVINYSESGIVNMVSYAPCRLTEVNAAQACTGSSSAIGGCALLANGQRIRFFDLPGAGGRHCAATCV